MDIQNPVEDKGEYSQLANKLGKDNTFPKLFLKELEKRLSEHPAPTVHSEFAVDWIVGHVYRNIGNKKDW